MNFALRIRHARRHAGLSQQALAEHVGVKRSAVSNWESATSVHPSMRNLMAIATNTGVALEWLATGRGDPELAHDTAMDIPTADAELVDSVSERALLSMYRMLSRRSQTLLMDLATALAPVKRASTARARNAA